MAVRAVPVEVAATDVTGVEVERVVVVVAVVMAAPMVKGDD